MNFIFLLCRVYIIAAVTDISPLCKGHGGPDESQECRADGLDRSQPVSDESIDDTGVISSISVEHSPIAAFVSSYSIVDSHDDMTGKKINDNKVSPMVQNQQESCSKNNELNTASSNIQEEATQTKSADCVAMVDKNRCSRSTRSQTPASIVKDTLYSHRAARKKRKPRSSLKRSAAVPGSSDTDDDTAAVSQDRSFYSNFLKQFCKHCGRNLQVPNSDCSQHLPERKPYPEGAFRYRVSQADEEYTIQPAEDCDSGLPSSVEHFSWSEWKSVMNEIFNNEKKLAASKEVTRRLFFVRHFLPRYQDVYGLHGYFNRINTGPSLTVEEQRQYEWLRFITFSEYQGEGNGIVLARNGFYHEPEQGRAATRCFACDVQHDQWQLFDNVEAEHRRLSPNCPLLHGNRGEGIRHNISIVADDIERARQNQARRAAAAAPAASAVEPALNQPAASGEEQRPNPISRPAENPPLAHREEQRPNQTARSVANPPPSSSEEQRPNQYARPTAHPASVPGGASNVEPGVTSLAQTGHARARTRTPDLQPTSLAQAGRARAQAQPLVTQPTASATGFTPQSGGNLTVTTVTGGQQESVSSVCFLMLSSCK